MYEQWFRTKEIYREDAFGKHDEDLATKIGQFQALLEGSIGVQEAVESLTGSSAASKTRPEDPLDYLWELLLDAAADLPDTHETVIDLLVVVGNQSTPQKRGKTTITWPGELQFSYLWRDTHDGLECYRDDTQGGKRREPPHYEEGAITPPQKWINFNAFSALLTAANLGGVALAWALFTLRDALEVQPETPKSRIEAPTHGKRVYVYSIDITAAAQWLIHAAKTIFHADNGMIDDHWKSALADETELWKGEIGFSRGRWDLWKAQLQAVERVVGVSDEAKEAAVRALANMDKAERQTGKK